MGNGVILKKDSLSKLKSTVNNDNLYIHYTHCTNLIKIKIEAIALPVLVWRLFLIILCLELILYCTLDSASPWFCEVGVALFLEVKFVLVRDLKFVTPVLIWGLRVVLGASVAAKNI